MKKVFIIFLLSFLTFTLKVNSQDWPMIYHDPAHTSVTAAEGPSTLNFAWQYQLGTALGVNWDYIHTSSPAVVDGKLYVGWTNGIVYCFDAATGGTPIWTKQLPYSVFSSPAVEYGYVYIGTYGGTSTNYLYCLDAVTGDSIWRYSFSGMLEQGPTVTDGRVFFGAWYNNNIYCLNAFTGALLWSASPDDVNYMWGHGGLPAVKDSLVFCNAGIYMSNNNTKFYAFKEFPSVNTGEVVWVHYETLGVTHQAMSVGNNRVYGSVDNGYMYCMKEHPATVAGELLWSAQSAPGFGGDPSCAAVDGDTIYYGHEDGKTFSRNASSNGSLLWQSTSLGGHCGVGSPAVTPTMLYLGTGYAGGGPSTQALFCLDKMNGDTLWSYPTNGYITSSPAVSNGMVFFTSHDGYVYAIGTWNTTGIVHNITNNNEIKIFPNPATDNIKIIIYQKATIEISNIQGQTILRKPIPQGKTDIDISGLAKGVYILRLNSDDKTEVARIIKE